MGDMPRQRQEQIMEWLVAERWLAIDVLAERLGVSVMTVHRDLDQLAAGRRVQKMYGGVELVEPRSTRETAPDSPVVACALCRVDVPYRTAFTVQRDNGELLHACCPHCGLLLLGSFDEALNIALTRDFLYGRMVNVIQAVYVLESRIELCCVPSVLCFANQTDARDFVRGFGGRMMGFDEVNSYLRQQHCHHRMNHSSG